MKVLIMNKIILIFVGIFWSIHSFGSYIPYAVTSGGNKFRIEEAWVAGVCTSTPCTIGGQSGSWLSSISRSATGMYAANINAGIFSVAPACIVGAMASTSTRCQVITNTPSTSSVSIYCQNPSLLADKDSGFNLICMGSR